MASREHKGEAIWLAIDAFMRSRVTLLSQKLLGNDDLPGIELLHSYYVVFEPTFCISERSEGVTRRVSYWLFEARSFSASESLAQTLPAATEYRRKSKVVTIATPRLADVRKISSASARSPSSYTPSITGMNCLPARSITAARVMPANAPVLR